MREEVFGKRFEEERALYRLENADVIDCVFAGSADGEYALEESRNVRLENCQFSVGYPLWHADGFRLHDSKVDKMAPGAIWHAANGLITDSDLCGDQAVRECRNIQLKDCTVISEAFGWKSEDVTVTDSTVNAQHLFYQSRNVKLNNVQVIGQSAFQSMENLEIDDSVLDTKDAFWNSRNVTVRNSVVKGGLPGLVF